MRARKHPLPTSSTILPFAKPATPSKEPQSELPLTGAKLAGKIRDFTCEVSVLQRYANNESDPLECIYEFPLKENASVTSFWAQIDDDKIVGQLKEKNEAKDTYDDAISSGHGAYLMEQDEEKKNLFKVNVGNLPPEKEILIGITYVMELDFDKEKLMFKLPVDANTFNSFQPSKSDKHKAAVDFGFSCKLDLAFSNSNIKTVQSPSHPIEFEFGDSMNEASVTLKAEPSQPLQKDFDLAITLKNPHETCAFVEQSEKDPNSKAAMFCVYPELDEDKDDVNAEIIFLVDRSGSMGSYGRIESVRKTLEVFLKSLPESITFNIHGFGSTFENLWDQSRKFSSSSLQDALNHAAGISANLGGTNILWPLQKIFKQNCQEGTPRFVFLLTDGQVSNTNEIIKCIRQNSSTTRVFTFGMGSGADKNLVEGAAKAGNGLWSFITDNQNVDTIVLKSLEKALKPTLTELKLELSSKIATSPTYLPPHYAGESILFYTFVKDNIDNLKLTLTGKYNKKKFVYTGEAKVKEAKPGNLIHSLAARSFIKDLEQKRSHMHTIDGNFGPSFSQSTVDDEIIALSLTHHILCKKTAFVAVEKRKEATEGTMQLRNIQFDSISTLPKEEPLAQTSGQRQSTFSSVSTITTNSTSRDRKVTDKKKKEKSKAMPQKNMLFGASKKSSNKSFDRLAAPSRSSSSAAPAFQAEKLSVASSFDLSPSLDQFAPAAPSLQRRNSLSLGSESDDEDESGGENAILSLLEEKKQSIEEEYELKEECERSRKEEESSYKRKEFEERSRQEEEFKVKEKLRNKMQKEQKEQKQQQQQQQQDFNFNNNNNNNNNTGLSQEQVRAIIVLVGADGSFGTNVLPLLQKNNVSSSSIKGVSDEKEGVVITALVALFLETECASHKSLWSLIVKKAKKYVANKASNETELYTKLKEKFL